MGFCYDPGLVIEPVEVLAISSKPSHSGPHAHWGDANRNYKRAGSWISLGLVCEEHMAAAFDFQNSDQGRICATDGYLKGEQDDLPKGKGLRWKQLDNISWVFHIICRELLAQLLMDIWMHCAALRAPTFTFILGDMEEGSGTTYDR